MVEKEKEREGQKESKNKREREREERVREEKGRRSQRSEESWVLSKIQKKRHA